MSRNNNPEHVLVTSGNQAVLAIDQTIDALQPGQIGVFNADTGLSISAASPVQRDIFIVVGIDREGLGNLDDIVESAGQLIQVRNLVNYNFREHTAPRNLIGVIGNYTGECETDYAVKVEFRNQQIYRTQGHNQFTKTYAFRTACCDECEACPSGDANEVTLKLIEAINADEAGLLTATAVARQAVTTATHGTSANIAAGAAISDADIQALIDFNALDGTADEDKVYTDVQIEATPLSIRNFMGINLNYFHPRGTAIEVSLVDGFNCAGNWTVTQELAFEEGNGYDIAQKEYHAAGVQQNKPYAVSESTNMAIEFDSFAVKSEKYDQFSLSYNQYSESGWLEYLNGLRTIIAVPATDTTTRDGLAAVLDKALNTTAMGFDVLADDAAAADDDPTVTVSTSDIDDPELDGIA